MSTESSNRRYRLYQNVPSGTGKSKKPELATQDGKPVLKRQYVSTYTDFTGVRNGILKRDEKTPSDLYTVVNVVTGIEISVSPKVVKTWGDDSQASFAQLDKETAFSQMNEEAEPVKKAAKPKATVKAKAAPKKEKKPAKAKATAKAKPTKTTPSGVPIVTRTKEEILAEAAAKDKVAAEAKKACETVVEKFETANPGKTVKGKKKNPDSPVFKKADDEPKSRADYDEELKAKPLPIPQLPTVDLSSGTVEESSEKSTTPAPAKPLTQEQALAKAGMAYRRKEYQNVIDLLTPFRLTISKKMQGYLKDCERHFAMKAEKEKESAAA